MLISERAMARAIRGGKIKDLLSMDVRRAVEGGWLELERGEAVTPEDDVADFVHKAGGAGLTLVMDGERLVGVITPFDLI